MLLGMFCLYGCDNNGKLNSESDDNQNTELKLGLGTQSYFEAVTNADEDKNGKAQSVTTFAAVLLGKDGKIVACELDCADITVEFTAEGNALKATSFKTKNELGYDYNMKKYGAAKEWFEQADAFAAATVGKTVDDVKAFVLDNGKGNSNITSAGCTIDVSDFALAIENAVKNAKACDANKKDTLNLGVEIKQSALDATDKKNGSNDLEISVSATAVDKDKKVSAAMSDCLDVKLSFDESGATTAKANEKNISKRNLGDDYGLKKSGAKKEWFEQADAFDAACIGKTASEITALVTNTGHGTEAVKTAGCTIVISAIAKAAVKSATVNDN